MGAVPQWRTRAGLSDEVVSLDFSAYLCVRFLRALPLFTVVRAPYCDTELAMVDTGLTMAGMPPPEFGIGMVVTRQ
jgi:hypothetical protein